MPELVTDVSDDEAERPPVDSDEPLAKAETTPVPVRAPVSGTDARGLGLETFEGRGPTGAVRVRKGSTRPYTYPLSCGVSAPPNRSDRLLSTTKIIGRVCFGSSHSRARTWARRWCQLWGT